MSPQNPITTRPRTILTTTFCNNGGNFISLFAQRIAETDYSDLTNVYNILVDNCEMTNTPVDISLNQWLEFAGVNLNALTTVTRPAATSIAANALTLGRNNFARVRLYIEQSQPEKGERECCLTTIFI
jgi:hypothetical protein